MPPSKQDFSWHQEIPKDEFWTPLDEGTSRNFHECFSAPELSEIYKQLPPNLTTEQKLPLLLDLLNAKLSTLSESVYPKKLSEVDYKTWMSLKVAISCILKAQGNSSEEEKIATEMMEAKIPEGKKNFAGMGMMAGVKERKGEYKEAEEMQRTVLEWIEGYEGLGKDSPQALGCRRALIRIIWKDGRVEEAKGLVKETGELIEGMKGGRFDVYYGEEKEELEAEVGRLEKLGKDK